MGNFSVFHLASQVLLAYFFKHCIINCLSIFDIVHSNNKGFRSRC